MNKNTIDLFTKKKPETTEEKEEVVTPETGKRHFIIVTRDFSGLGWAKKLQDEGNDVIMAFKLKDDDDKAKEAKKVGKGIVEVMELDHLFAERKNYKDSYWIFDMNIHMEYAKKLSDEGYKVLGGQEISERMENERNFASDLMNKYGIKSPTTMEFTSPDEGLKFLENNPDTAYVFKPDEPNHICYTFVPDNEKNELANKELQVYLSSISDTGTYILQERIKGVETNVEVWFYKGKPFFAFCDIECKKKLNGDFGGMVGCAQSIDFVIPLECKAIRTTIAKLYDYYKDLKYTGFVDANIIVFDNENFYLETCNRFGYNAHPNLLLSVAKNPIGDILADFIDGKINDFYDNFRYGFGASISLYSDDPRSGVPLFIEKEANERFYMFDAYKEGEQLFLTGYGSEIGICTAHAYTIKSAAQEVLEITKKIRFPLRGMRSDLDKNDYDSSPQGRYDALEAMSYFDKE